MLVSATSSSSVTTVPWWQNTRETREVSTGCRGERGWAVVFPTRARRSGCCWRRGEPSEDSWAKAGPEIAEVYSSDGSSGEEGSQSGPSHILNGQGGDREGAAFCRCRKW